MQPPYLRSQGELAAHINNGQMRDPGFARWKLPEVYRAINDALLEWDRRVRLPQIYNLPNGFSTQAYEYALPNYVQEPLDVQIQYTGATFYGEVLPDGGVPQWRDIASYRVEPDGAGGLTLRLGYLPPAEAGRVVWWAANGQVPLTVPKLSSGIDGDDTSLTLDAALTVEQTGWVKIGAEWLFYAGVSRDATTTTLNNLLRAQYGTTAAGHSTGDDVEWGVAADDLRLYNQLYDAVRANLHALFLTDAANQEGGRHGVTMDAYRQRADMFWRTYAPRRRTKLVLDRMALGPTYA